MSAELVVQNQNLPDTIEDLSKFVLIGREKLNSVRAEIRVIDKLKLAENVHKQKQDEASMLAEAVLDAEVRLGELFKEIPKKSGGNRGNQYTGGKIRSSADFGKNDDKSKKEVVQDLGFSQDQAEHFEVLAENKDIVEYVKAEARENEDVPTRTRVLELAAHKLSTDGGYDEYVGLSYKVEKEMRNITNAVNRFEITDHRMDALADHFDDVVTVNDQIVWIEEARDKLNLIIAEFRKAARRMKKI